MEMRTISQAEAESLYCDISDADVDAAFQGIVNDERMKKIEVLSYAYRNNPGKKIKKVVGYSLGGIGVQPSGYRNNLGRKINITGYLLDGHGEKILRSWYDISHEFR
jgi:hypothetical protein